MFCPKCAAQNLDGASFCRVCGANISLVPQALSGQLANQDDSFAIGERSRRRHGTRSPNFDSAFKNIFMSVAFLAISFWLFHLGKGWWFWMLIPAFSMFGSGLAQF